MYHTRSTMLAAAVLLVFGPTAFAATMDFDTVAAGTTYGNAAGDVPGDVVLTQDDITMSVEEFHLTASSFTGFVEATIGGLTAPEFPTQPLSLNNISVQFDFSGVPFPVGYVSFRYVDLGGEENLSVNGASLHEVAVLSAVPVAVAPGVTLSVFENPIAGGVSGQVILTGPVSSLTVGGQEFGIDDVIVLQDPPDDSNDPQDGSHDDSMDGSHDDSTDGPHDDSMDGPDDGPQDGPMDGPQDGGPPPFGGLGDITVNCGGLPGIMMTLFGLLTLRFATGHKSW